MSDSRRWEHLRSIGAVLADRTFSLNSLRSDVADAAGYFETATAAEPEAEAVHVFLDGLAQALTDVGGPPE